MKKVIAIILFIGLVALVYGIANPPDKYGLSISEGRRILIEARDIHQKYVKYPQYITHDRGIEWEIDRVKDYNGLIELLDRLSDE